MWSQNEWAELETTFISIIEKNDDKSVSGKIDVKYDCSEVSKGNEKLSKGSERINIPSGAGCWDTWRFKQFFL